MSWDAIGALGEIFGALAVVATLVYLSSQIRQTNRIAKSSVNSELMQKYTDFLNDILTSQEVGELSTRLTDPGYVASSDLERQQIKAFTNCLMNIWFSAESSFTEGQMEASLYKIYCEDVSVRLKQWPAIRVYAVEMLESYPNIHDLKIFAPVFDDG